MNETGKIIIVAALVVVVALVLVAKNSKTRSEPPVTPDGITTRSPAQTPGVPSTPMSAPASQAASSTTASATVSKSSSVSTPTASATVSKSSSVATNPTAAPAVAASTKSNSTSKVSTPSSTAIPASLPRLVDLGAGKCIPCKMMFPILDEIKAEYAGQLQVEFIDVWKNPQAGRKYGIRLIPTQIFYDAAGKELYRHEGFFAKDDIIAQWKSLGVTLTRNKP